MNENINKASLLSLFAFTFGLVEILGESKTPPSQSLSSRHLISVSASANTHSDLKSFAIKLFDGYVFHHHAVHLLPLLIQVRPILAPTVDTAYSNLFKAHKKAYKYVRLDVKKEYMPIIQDILRRALNVQHCFVMFPQQHSCHTSIVQRATVTVGQLSQTASQP